MQYVDYYDSPLGRIRLTSDEEALTGLDYDREGYVDQIHDGQDASEPIRATRKWLDLYFNGETPDFMPAIRMEGTDFQKEVWTILLTIPYGQTVSYGSIAAQIAQKRGMKRMSAQAVGGAVGSNPISLIVPCHRVIGADGSMVGYGGGLDRKIWLLQHEAVAERSCKE